MNMTSDATSYSHPDHWVHLHNFQPRSKCLPEVREPLDELSSVVLVELDVWEVHLQHGTAGVAHPEEHELGLAQVHRGQRRRVGIS